MRMNSSRLTCELASFLVVHVLRRSTLKMLGKILNTMRRDVSAKLRRRIPEYVKA